MSNTRTIIIGDGLTNKFLSPQHQFSSFKENLGQREIARLLGRGKVFGRGPLVTFLEHATTHSSCQDVSVFLLSHAESNHHAGDGVAQISTADEFVDPISTITEASKIVATDGDTIPLGPLLAAIFECLGLPGPLQALDGTDVRFLIVGCHTEKRVLTIASFLRCMLGASEVAVSSHLVGSATQEAHLATLRYNLPGIGVRVILDFEETAAYVGLDPELFTSFEGRPCQIEPAEAREAMHPDQKRIVELLCLHWTKAKLRPLAGGFSGSALYLAEGWKGDARTEPMVLKIDAFEQMRRELGGYYQVKDLFGKNVPTFGYPVTEGDALGVGMELAAMEGSPETLQDLFEEADTEAAVNLFAQRFGKALSILSDKLYRNTRESSWVVPYREFELHAAIQLEWLKSNTDIILKYLEQDGADETNLDSDHLVNFVRLIARNEDGIESEACLVHGDLNLANIICDDGDNIWFIDWTHCGTAPIELDFAKLENDVKFVMTKTFDLDDLPRLREFEDYMLEHRIPADLDELPGSLKFAKWDLRYRKILTTVRQIRRACFELKRTDDWLVYRVALLKYATHTLSFDQRQDRGECEPAALAYALFSVEHLTFNLVADDFHLKIRAERPDEYPERQRILIDESIWAFECETYDPPYYVHPSVLANDCTLTDGGWADPEDVSSIRAELEKRPAKNRDDTGRPLNPRGRTGIEGRGLLGYWGANLSVAAVVVRNNQMSELEILLSRREDESEVNLPKGFVLNSQTMVEGLGQVLNADTGWNPDPAKAELIFEGYTYDPRQTDHSWIETNVYLLFDGENSFPDSFDAGNHFDEVVWFALDDEIVNRLPSSSAPFAREAVKKLSETKRMSSDAAERLLAGTG